ncbi:cholesterol oxidase [Nocardia mangyaensis]|uniref:Cholesterol oxidase n=1 Tax=Nocardia mangyaensis TaxID=2213200 RepID=A0A1J0VNF8_9NOCA|nr:GMC oxidoreductase [Nocardia mangyaensis]APE33580.1 cholesterol oxidase [Nocardia mangyaensis]
MDRRAFIRSSALGATLGVASVLTAAPSPTVADDDTLAAFYRTVVPEIFAPLPDPPQHCPTIVIGSGFGGAVSALRLAEADAEVAVLERGSRWPNDPWRDVFSSETLPDGRGIWHRDSFSDVLGSITGVPVPLGVDDFGGVLCIDNYPNMRVLRGAAVGGGSIVYTGVSVQPERRFFDAVFAGVVDYGEMNDVYYPLARRTLRVSAMPDDIYHSPAFAHSRAWDAAARRAGYLPLPSESTWNWNVLRDELAGRSRPSATIGRSTMGNSNAAKIDLNQTYLRHAENTGRVRIYPGHTVNSIVQERDRRFSVHTTKLAPTGQVLRTRTLTCDRLFLAAGSIGTTELLVRARATGTLSNLNEHIGAGWGPNGNVVMAPWTLDTPMLGTQGAAVASRLLDESGTPTVLENFSVPGVPVDVGLLVVIGLVLDDTRGTIRYDPSTDRAILDWPDQGGAASIAAAGAVSSRVAAAGVSLLPATAGYAAASSHPLGGAVIGRATDHYGRVHGHPGLYVVDGAAIPGNAGAANPSLTITALAERNIEQIIRDGR